MQFQICLLTIISCLNIAYGQIEYEFEFLDERVYIPCEEYPDNFLDKLFNITTLDYGQTEDGSMIVNGYTTLISTVEEILPLSIEVYKKGRGTWQPTIYSQKRNDTCTSVFSKTELWHSYVKNMPDEQKTCPFKEGQRLDFDINEPTYMSLPIRNAEGDYKIQAMLGTKNADIFVCVNIYATVHKK